MLEELAANNALPTTPPVAVTAKQLHSDYNANEVAAGEKDKGQNLMVRGTV